jgi:predicted RecB family nuclease
LADADGTIEEFRLGAYAARSCAVMVQWDVLRPCDPAPDSPFSVELARRGREFEQEVFEELRAQHPDAVRIDGPASAEEKERQTLAALDAGVRLVLGPHLPPDPESGRVGRPDLLVRDGTSGYVPVDVKHHRTLDGEARGDLPGEHPGAPPDALPGDLHGTLHLGELGHLALPRRPHGAGAAGSERSDLLQLAHYRRMLETLGFAADGVPTGAIIGRERRVVGYDLTEPRFSDGSGERRSALALYDVEFAERRRVAHGAAAWRTDPALGLPIEPVRISECATCRWREHCGALLEERQDVSLLPRVGRPDWEALRRIGADTIPALAALATSTPAPGMSEGAFVAAVAHARARVGPDVAYRRPGVARVEVERADVELDVDMENVEEGAYLWGVHVTDRAGSGLVAAGYHAFVDWDEDAEVAGSAAFVAFWTWLAELRRGCAERGLSLRVYHWSAAERRWLREAARNVGIGDEVDAVVSSQEWVDLLPVFRSQVITGYGNGLKVIAPMLGFAWDDDDPSGTSSMLWWQEAVDPQRSADERERVRQRLLAYNADDVRATLHVREWLDAHRSSIPELPGG